MDTAAIAERLEQVETDGGPIALRRLGAGPPLVLINGYGATKADWDPEFLGRLASFAELICPDNRGVGDSGAAPEELTVEAMAADLLAVLDRLGIERAPVLGWSMGGFVAQALAAGDPERVESLILLSTDPGGPASVTANEEDWAALLDHSGSPEERAGRLIALLFPEPVAERIEAEFGPAVAAAQSQLDPRTLAAQERAMALWRERPAEARLGAIGCPTLCAGGREDRVIPIENSALLAELLPDAWLARFPDAGHAFMAQAPVRIAALIRAFLDR